MKWNTKHIQVIKKKKVKDKNKNKVDGSNRKGIARCRLKYSINNYIRCKWTKNTNPKKRIIKLQFSKNPIIILSPTKHTLK